MAISFSCDCTILIYESSPKPLTMNVEFKRTKKKEKAFVIDSKTKKKRLSYETIIDKHRILIYPEKERYSLPTIELEGFDLLPNEFLENGAIKAGVLYYLDKKLKNLSVNSIVISNQKQSSFARGKMLLSYSDFQELRAQLSRIIYESKVDKGHYVDDFFAEKFPKDFQSAGLSSRFRYKRVIENINKDIIEHFDTEGLEKIESFYEELISTKYKSRARKNVLVRQTKMKIDNLAIDTVINEFAKLLSDDPSENLWGEFLLKNLYLIDSKYIHAFPQLNVVLAGARKVDFGLADSFGYLDIFEIKKSSTGLLSANKDRGNYYWHVDSIKAITQAEKYLFEVESKRHVFQEDIKRQKGIEVTVIKPRAFLIIGCTEQLNSDEKKTDFRILRHSLKNIELVLYDELFERIKNQKNKIFI
jgi:hypothetical protein